MPILDIVGIQDLLPHRYPFLLIDRVEVLEEDSVVALKNVTANEPYFQGHFPGYPVMPGVLIVEAMAQAAGILVLSKMPDRHTKHVYLATVVEARFRRPVVPGDQLRLEVKMVHGRPTRAKLEGKGFVGETMVAEATFMCVLQDKAPPQ